MLIASHSGEGLMEQIMPDTEQKAGTHTRIRWVRARSIKRWIVLARGPGFSMLEVVMSKPNNLERREAGVWQIQPLIPSPAGVVAF